MSRMHRGDPVGRTGFTLIELLTVVSIIALLISILLPSLGKAREQANKVYCMNNQKQLATANYYYSVDYKGKLPHWDLWLWDRYLERDGEGRVTWANVIEGGQLFGCRPPKPTSKRRQGRSYAVSAEIYKCPSDRGERRWFDALRPGRFSYSRNKYVMDVLVTNGLWAGEKTPNGWFHDYLPFDSFRRSAEIPLLLEEHEASALNDGYSWPFSAADSEILADRDFLSMRHFNKAALAYHDLHVAVVPSKEFNSSAYWSPAKHDVLAHALPPPVGESGPVGAR